MWLCAGFLLLLAAPAVGNSIRVASYNSWQSNGFSRSSSPAALPAATQVVLQTAAPAALTSALWDTNSSTATATSLIVSTLSESTNNGALSNGLDYSTWQWNGFSSSTLQTFHTSSTLAVSSLVDTGGGVGTLSGFVYVDTNQNHIMDAADWAIADAKVSLALSGSGGVLTELYTQKDGSYNFSGLSAGAYTITMLTVCSQPGQDNGAARTILNKDGIPISVGTAGTVGQDTYSNVVLADGYSGIHFNFAENAYPIEVMSKRMILNTDPGVTHTTDIVPVPEPSSFVLLTIAGLLLGVWTRGGWRRLG
jgi:hypothetical protein